MRRVLLLLSLAGLAISGVVDPSRHANPYFRANVAEDHRENPSVEADDSDASLRVPQLIVKYGYNVEEHWVTTEDGYILNLHRMPYSDKCGPAEGKRVAFLQHGLLADSSNWVINGPEKSLAYNLVDNCYDVWMGNFRGNTYSKNHTTLSHFWNRKRFWRYSYDEMGLFDLPASLDYVLEKTGAEGIYYTGHSMGTTAFFILMSEKPEYNAKIKLANLMAPVAFTKNMISPIRLLALFDGPLESLIKLMGVYELLPSNKFMEWMGQAFCKETNPFVEMCNNIVFLLAGYNYDQIDRSLLPTLMGHMPSGTSVDTILHFAQGINSGNFQKYDFGIIKNLAVYKSIRPPKYDLTKVTAPVALWWGNNDWLAAKKDVARIVPLLPNLLLNQSIEHGKWNHFDFIIAKDMKQYIVDPVTSFMENY